MRDESRFRFNQRVARRIRPARALGWFLGVCLPIALALSLFIHWHNGVVGPPQPIHLLIRALIGLVAFGIGLFIVWWKVIRPVIRAIEKEDDEAT